MRSPVEYEADHAAGDPHGLARTGARSGARDKNCAQPSVAHSYYDNNNLTPRNRGRFTMPGARCQPDRHPYLLAGYHQTVRNVWTTLNSRVPTTYATTTAAPMIKQIEQPGRLEWHDAFEVITSQSTGQPVTVQFLSAATASELIARNDPPAYITYLDKDDVVVVCLRSVGDDHIGREHSIEHPDRIIFDPPSTRTARRIQIQDVHGARTLIALPDQHADPPPA
jgi:hypothetical protein